MLQKVEPVDRPWRIVNLVAGESGSKRGRRLSHLFGGWPGLGHCRSGGAHLQTEPFLPIPINRLRAVLPLVDAQPMPFRVVKIVQFLPSILTRALARICNLGVIDSCNNAHLYLSSVSGLYVQKKWISDCVRKGRIHCALLLKRRDLPYPSPQLWLAKGGDAIL